MENTLVKTKSFIGLQTNTADHQWSWENHEVNDDTTRIIVFYLLKARERVLDYVGESTLSNLLEGFVIDIVVADYRLRGFEGLKRYGNDDGNYEIDGGFNAIQPQLDRYLMNKSKRDKRVGFRFL